MSVLAWAAPALAAQVQVIVEPRTLTLGQVGSARVLVLLEDREDVDAGRPPPLPTGAGLHATFSGQAQSLETNVSLGRIVRTREFRYALAAVAEGAWEVGPVDLATPRGTAHAEPVTVTVTPKPTGAAPDASVEATLERAGGPTGAAWEGELVTYRKTVRYRAGIEAQDPGDPPFDGLRALGAPKASQYVVEDDRGQLGVYEQLSAYVAATPGVHAYGPATIAVKTPVPGSSRLFRRTTTEVVASAPLGIEVRARPAPPPDWSGIVGDVTVTSVLAATDVEVGQSVPWTLLVSGAAALDGIELPNPELPGVSVYASDPTVRLAAQGGAWQSSATFRWTLVPTEPGPLPLPDQALVVFSPSKGRYERLPIDLPDLTVTGEEDDGGVLRGFGVATGVSEAEDGLAVRPPYASGSAVHRPLAGVFGAAGLLLAVPGAGALLGDVWRVRRAAAERRRQARVPRPPTAAELVRDLPADPVERLATLDHALRLAAAGRDADPRVRALRARLGRARFGGGPGDGAPQSLEDGSLEDEVRRLVDAIAAEAA